VAIDQNPKAVQTVRKLRHWKQHWPHGRDAVQGAVFVWRKATAWPNPEKPEKLIRFPAGAIVPDWVQEAMGPAKLRRWWESQRIELAEVGDAKAVQAAAATPSKKKNGKKKTETPEQKAKREARNAAKKAARAEAKDAEGEAEAAAEAEAEAAASSDQSEPSGTPSQDEGGD
jgi:hypothetical protein